MAAKPLALSVMRETLDAYERHQRSRQNAAAELGLSVPTFESRLKAARVAEQLGRLATLTLHRSFDPDEDEGIVGFLRDRDKTGHVAFCKRGLVWDMDGTIWELDAYLEATGYRAVSLLVAA